MLQYQFNMRLMLLFLVGIVYVKAYMNMAKRNSKETDQERHLVLRVIGVFWAVMAILMGGLGVYMITQIQFPQEAIGPYISPNMIVRTSDQTMYWGYATSEQSQCISIISGVFEFLALSAYCFMFKSSHSKWYSKVGKIVFCILFYMFYASATDFHYFDLSELTAPVLFAIMAFFAFRNKQKEKVSPIAEENIVDNRDNVLLQVKAPIETNNEEHSKYMPHIEMEKDILNRSEENSLDTDNTSHSETTLADKPSVNNTENIDSSLTNEPLIDRPTLNKQCTLKCEDSEPVIRFCRHCGAKLDYQGVKYCKYCGKQIY